MKPLRLSEEARAELLHETSYYEKKREGAGKRFREAVSASFALILRFPGGGAPGPAGTRKTKVRGFPFTVVYREEEFQIVVFAISPDRQQPGYWLPRTGADGARLQSLQNSRAMNRRASVIPPWHRRLGKPIPSLI